MRALKKYVKGFQKVWLFLVFSIFGIGTIYFLNVTGIITAMRNDHTLDYLYQANQMLPVAPEDLLTLSPQAQRKTLSQSNDDPKILADIIETYKPKEPQTKNIPQILHQIWDTYSVPKSFLENMRSWLKINPKWEYWFWTEKAIKCMISKGFPKKYSLLFSEYPDATSRADAARYFILSKFGGFYADLDARCLKPLDVWADSFWCILTYEPNEHSHLVREQNFSSIVNSPLACAANHPFYSALIANLTRYAGLYFGDYLHSTGPYFLEAVYKDYVDTSDADSPMPIIVTPSKYFLPRYDASQGEIVESKCDIRHYKKLPALQMQVCQELIKNSYKNEPFSDSFMDHSWIHVSTMHSDWKTSNTFDFFQEFPNALNLETKFCLS